MNDRRIDLAALILRLTLGTMFVAHGLLKVFVFTPAGTAKFFESLSRNPDGSPIFPVALTPALFLGASTVAILVGLLASYGPARRAARLDPATVIRHD
jgi:lipoprotein-releasing system permease protein